MELKAAHSERVLLYHLGDSFECFFEDVIELSWVLELTLTGKEVGKAIGRVTMGASPSEGALLKREPGHCPPGTVNVEGMLSARCKS